MILLLLQFTPTGDTTYPIDVAHCNAFLNEIVILTTKLQKIIYSYF